MRCARRDPPGAPRRSGLALELSDLLGLVLDPILGSVQLFLLFAFGLFLATLAAKRGIAGDIAGGLLRAAGHFVDEAHRITSWPRSYPRGESAKRRPGRAADQDAGCSSSSACTASSSLRSALRMIRETCIWETPRRRPISYWFRSSSKRSLSTVRSRSVRGAPSAAICASTRS